MTDVNTFRDVLCVEGRNFLNEIEMEKLDHLEACSHGMMIGMTQVKDAITEAKKKINYARAGAKDQETCALESPMKCRKITNNAECEQTSLLEKETARDQAVASQVSMVKEGNDRVRMVVDVVHEKGFELPTCTVLCPTLRIPMVKGDKDNDKIDVLGEVVQKEHIDPPVSSFGPDSAVRRRVRVRCGPAANWIVEGKLAYSLDDKVVSRIWANAKASPNIFFYTRWLFQHPDGREPFTVLHGADWSVEMNGGLSAFGLKDLQMVKDEMKEIIADVVLKQHEYVMIEDHYVMIERQGNLEDDVVYSPDSPLSEGFQEGEIN